MRGAALAMSAALLGLTWVAAPGAQVVASGAGAALAPVSSGVWFTDSAGRFRDRFPSRPELQQLPGSLASMRFTLYLALVKKPQPLEVAAERITPALPSSARSTTMHAAVGSFGLSSGFTLSPGWDKPVEYRGHPARKATLSKGTLGTYTLLVFMPNGGELYLLFAPR
ncbi:MAG: hypothetical protein ACREOD_03295, partial [Candidatus Dormibacteria bacterium]